MITRFSLPSLSMTNWVRIGMAVMWSTGFEKKPCSWPAWRSIVTRRSMPATSSVSATRRAEIGSRGADFLSWREYPYQGLTAMMRCAEACLAAWTIRSSSHSESFGVIPSRSDPHIDWTMKRSAPRIDSA